MDTDACQPLYHAIIDFFEGNENENRSANSFASETQVLNEADEMEKQGFHHSEARGLCISEELTITTIMRRQGIQRPRIGMRTGPPKLHRKREVAAIIVLYGFPRLLTGAILAHELMHAWLHLKDFRNLRPEVEEGICQLVSYKWLESEVAAVGPTSTTSIEKKLREFFLYQIVTMASPVYGEGFRAAAAAVDRYGLRTILSHIRLTGTFPE